MSGIDLKKEQIHNLAQFFGLGFYRVTKDGQFVECDSIARKLFGIPEEENDLSKHSIKNLYVMPVERDLKIKKIIGDKGKPFKGTLSLQIEEENKLLFDLCWHDKSFQDKGEIVGLATEIEESDIIPRMFDTFSLGLYEVDKTGRVVRVNKKFVEILKCKDEDDILNTPLSKFCEKENDLELFNKEVKKKRSANRVLKLIDANNKIIDVEFFSKVKNAFENIRWGMINDVTERLRYVRAVEEMPRGFFYIERAKYDKDHENERLTQCNERYARILGFEKKEDAIGQNIAALFQKNKKEREKFFKELYKADKKGEPLLNYFNKTRRISDNKVIYLSMDVHLLKDSNGKVVGREGTIRDITGEIELKNRVKEAEKRLEKTTADINKLIHTFLHPVLKFAGNSELLYQVGSILHKTIQPEKPLSYEVKELGDELMVKLVATRAILPEIDENISYANIKKDNRQKDKNDLLTFSAFKEKLTEIINVFDYSLQTEKSRNLLDSTIRDTALWVLVELDRINYIKNRYLKDFIKVGFIKFLQGILFNHLIRGASILMAETIIMKREVEALRGYIGLKKKRKYSFVKRDIGTILEENIERFKPILLEKEIEILYTKKGNLEAEISPDDIDRLICNLFQNASKYSYSGEGRFLKVIAGEIKNDNIVQFSVESFGIPIKREEISSGNIFKFGYRGELAFKSDRVGTGVGLADAKDVVEAHKGELEIDSRPAPKRSEPSEYEFPYLTKITIKIPKKVRNNGG